MSLFTLSYFFVKNRVFREEIAIPDGQLDLLVFWCSMFIEFLLTITYGGNFEVQKLIRQWNNILDS